MKYVAKESEIFEKLTKAAKENGHFKVYNKENILARWHANNTQRFGPIVAVADVPYAFQDMYDEAKWYEKEFNVTSELSFIRNYVTPGHFLHFFVYFLSFRK